MQETKYTCTNCEKELLLDEKPCKECGSVKRKIYFLLVDKISLYEQIRTKQKCKVDGKVKIIHEQKIGDELFKETGELRVIRRVIDHLNDKYTEKIINKSDDKVIINKKEKLSEHFDHGYAKYKRNKY